LDDQLRWQTLQRRDFRCLASGPSASICVPCRVGSGMGWPPALQKGMNLRLSTALLLSKILN